VTESPDPTSLCTVLEAIRTGVGWVWEGAYLLVLFTIFYFTPFMILSSEELEHGTKSWRSSCWSSQYLLDSVAI